MQSGKIAVQRSGKQGLSQFGVRIWYSDTLVRDAIKLSTGNQFLRNVWI